MLCYEKECAAKGYRLIAGVDEAGRGPLAGPVACAAAIMPTDCLIDGVDDSKKLSEKKREYLYDQITEKALSYSVVLIDHDVIDEINILNATKRGMEEAIGGLTVKPDIVLLDAVILPLAIPSISIIHGDALSYNIAAASILAKVTRDRLMREYDLKYPEYQFAKHKGYGTKLHYEMIEKYGVCPIHRRSFLKKVLKHE